MKGIRVKIREALLYMLATEDSSQCPARACDQIREELFGGNIKQMDVHYAMPENYWQGKADHKCSCGGS